MEDKKKVIISLSLILTIIITLAVLYAIYEFYYKYDKIKPYETKEKDDMEKIKIIWQDSKNSRHIKYQINDIIIETYYNDKPLKKVEFKNNNLNELLKVIKENVEDEDLARLILAIAIQEQSAHNPLKTHPNNNYWGIQTDSGRWFHSEYIDYRFIAREGLTGKPREFAGFNTLERAVLFMKNVLLTKRLEGNKIPGKEEFPKWYWLYWLGATDTSSLDNKRKQALLAVYNEASKYV
ncbi:MAG: hypothetical protein ABIL45_04330 [candidate division WOR-3 bacterium]